MAKEVVGRIPDFADEKEETAKSEAEETEVKSDEDKTEPEQEKDTPSETSTDENQPEAEVKGKGDDVKSAISGLEAQRAKLLKEIRELRGARREAKQAQIDKVDEDIDNLSDLNADDVAVVERVLKAKGYVRKDEVQELTYEQIKTQALDKFLDIHPEYRPENDPDDERWQQLQDELSLYQRPADPQKIGELLEKAHRVITPSDYQKPKDQRPERGAIEKRLDIARAGSGGQKTNTGAGNKFDSAKREMLRRGGWSDADIAEMEKKLK